METCEYNCKEEGPPGPVWCTVCGHAPSCCTCEDKTDSDRQEMTPEERERENVRLQQEYIEWLLAGSPRTKEEEERCPA